jgi:hypothetical protein
VLKIEKKNPAKILERSLDLKCEQDYLLPILTLKYRSHLGLVDIALKRLEKKEYLS